MLNQGEKIYWINKSRFADVLCIKFSFIGGLRIFVRFKEEEGTKYREVYTLEITEDKINVFTVE